MKVKLDGLSVEVSDLSVEENDVFVDFEYERLNQSTVKFYLRCFAGKSLHTYRFCLKTIHLIDLEDQIITDEHDLVQSIIDELIEPLIEMIITVDKQIKEPKERLN